jgi:glyoxylate/hydroxypyruvate reductase
MTIHVLLQRSLSDGEMAQYRQLLELSLPPNRFKFWLGNEAFDPQSIDVMVLSNPSQVSFAGFERLRFIQSLWAGVDRLLGAKGLPHDIPIARMVDPEMTQAMVQSACLHVLWLYRQMPTYRTQQQSRLWQQLEQPPASECTVTIFGFGELGRHVGNALQDFGFKVFGVTSELSGSDPLKRALSNTDYVINLMPLTKNTEGYFNRSFFSQLKRGASFINLARGSHVVDDDLREALDDGQLKFAVLDVFGVEPLPSDAWQWDHPHVVVTPHVAADTRSSSAVKVVVNNLERFANGEPILHLVDRTKGY